MRTAGKMIALGAGIAVVVGAGVGVPAVKLSADASDARIAELEHTMREDFDRSARRQVEQAMSMLQAVADRATRGEISLDEAKSIGANLLRRLRYGEGLYFTADTLEGVNVVLLGRDSEGKSRWELTDTHGSKVIQAMNRLARDGGGFVDFWFPKASGGEAFRKRNYVALFEPFGWVVGTGNYIDDIDAIVAAKRTAALAARRGQLVTIALLVLLVSALATAAAVILSRTVTRPLQRLAEEAARMQHAFAEGQLSHRADPATVNAEFQPIVESMNHAVDTVFVPFKTVVEYMERISHGDIPPRRTNAVRGEVVPMQQSLNRCIDSVHQLVQDVDTLARAAVAGQLGVRADASRHQGDFRKVVDGVNATLDAAIGPVQDASVVLERLARRDLTARMNGSYQGDHARIKDALNSTAEALHDAMSAVSEAVGQVSSASAQIASSSQAVASGASEQAASLQETSSSLESMASMTKQSADNAQLANGLAQGATVSATEGSAAMEQMTGAMAKIKASAEGTSQIIKDINEIAFQTNLLALNAAVEAARAGEAGRGFAVVAEEVRALALRSKDAANKTEDLIRQSVREAGEGEVTARHVNAKLGEIAGSVTKVSGIIAEIAASAKEQAVSIEQVTSAVSQMNQATQQNAASSEESSSAAAELSGRAEDLTAMIGTFHLQGTGAAARNPVKQAPSPRRNGDCAHLALRASTPFASGSFTPAAQPTSTSTPGPRPR